jgi:hypothetical protein
MVVHSDLIDGLGGQLATDGRNVSQPALAGALIEPKLGWQIGDCQQRELFGGGGGCRTCVHVCIIARGCYVVPGPVVRFRRRG